MPNSLVSTNLPLLQQAVKWVLGQTVPCRMSWTDSITGQWTEKHPLYCDDCHGIGHIPDPQWAAVRRVLVRPCARCNGDGWLDWGEGRSECSACRGTGYEANQIWQQLWEQGNDGALAGALVVAVANGGRWVLTVEADGPGFVARIWPNGPRTKTIVEVWSDGGEGKCWPDDPPTGTPRPSADSAALCALLKAGGEEVQ